jgi:hypothetical protein
MYLRTIARRNKDGSEVRYYQLDHNVTNPRGQAQARVLYSFGWEEHLDREAPRRLIRSISRVLEPGEALPAGPPGDLTFRSSRSSGGAYVLDQLWRRLEVDRAVRAAFRRRRYPQRVERVIFTLVANRCLEPSSKLACCAWASDHALLPGVEPFSEDDACRGMD